MLERLRSLSHSPLARDQEKRSRLRRQVRQASRADREAFLALTDEYLDFVTEYLYLSAPAPSGALSRRTIEVFSEIWKQLGSAWRLSDFERILAVTLLERTDKAETEPGPMVQRVSSGTPQERFALVATNLEDWAPAAAALACRVSQQEFDDLLFAVRSRLCGVSTGNLSREEVDCMRLISNDLCESISIRSRAALCQRVEKLEIAREFRAACIEGHCELIELRQRIRLPTEEKQQLLTALGRHLAPDTMQRPQWLHRFLNLVHFGNLPGTRAH